mgnify:FL=1
MLFVFLIGTNKRGPDEPTRPPSLCRFPGLEVGMTGPVILIIAQGARAARPYLGAF